MFHIVKKSRSFLLSFSSIVINLSLQKVKVKVNLAHCVRQRAFRFRVFFEKCSKNKMYHTYIYFLTHICKVFLNILLVYYISYYLSIYYVGFFYILSLVKHSSSSGISSFLFLLLLRAFPIPRVVDRIEKTLKRDNLQSFEISKFFNIPQKFQKKSYLFFSWNLAFRFLHQQFSNKFIDILLRLSQKFKLTSRARKRGTMSDSYRCYRTPER